jgi:hypothetical protein
VGETRREGERKRTLAAGADEPERHRASRRLYPSSAESGGTRRDDTGRGGRTKRREIKAIAGDGASCLGFCFRLDAGSIPAASTDVEAVNQAIPLMAPQGRSASRAACEVPWGQARGESHGPGKEYHER